ncbi:MAG: protein-L-isoaspartate(D-aspartate) O-methyltransferase [Terriglobia bacterium]
MNQRRPNFRFQRQMMVELQMRQRAIWDERVLAACLEVPRHEFVPPNYLPEAYQDHPLPIGEGQTISQPYMVAVMTEALSLRGEECVLEIGTGSGYQTAILARLAREVYSIECYATLARQAEERLQRLGVTNARVVVGDGSQGYPAAAPYDGIVVAAGAPRVPAVLVEQLADGGRLVIPVGDMHSQELLLVLKHGNTITQKSVNHCRFVPLTGKYGWGGSETP